MSVFRNWYVKHQDAITWFIIGFLTQTMLYNFSHGDWLWGLITAAIICLNYSLRKVRLQ
jgi:hypothetical protein